MVFPYSDVYHSTKQLLYRSRGTGKISSLRERFCKVSALKEYYRSISGDLMQNLRKRLGLGSQQAVGGVFHGVQPFTGGAQLLFTAPRRRGELCSPARCKSQISNHIPANSYNFPCVRLQVFNISGLFCTGEHSV